MQIPAYRKIHLNSADPNMIVQQLDQMSLREFPFLMIITHLEESEISCLNTIAKYFEKRPQKTLPYPLFILTTVKQHPSELNLIEDESVLPRYFKVKERALNNKEQAQFAKVNLLKKNFAGLNLAEGKGILKEFAADHKIVRNLDLEHQYLKNLLTKLEGKHEQ